MTSAYDNVVTGKLRLKGRALDVKGGVKKKKNKHSKSFHYDRSIQVSTGGNALGRLGNEDWDEEEGRKGGVMDCMMAAERRYMEQVERIEAKRMAKMAAKSHRDRVQEFNQYLADCIMASSKLALANNTHYAD